MNDDNYASPMPSPALLSRAQRRRTVIFGNPELGEPLLTAQSNRPTYWVPESLKTYWMISNIVLLLVVAVALEIVLRINHHSYGWETPAFYAEHPWVHLLWTAVPGLFAVLIAHEWKEVDQDIKILQPYVDMSLDEGGTAEKTVLLNYQRKNPILVQIPMIRNRHYIPLIANAVCLLALAASPLASAYLYLQSPPESFTQSLSNVTVIEELGLQNPIPFSDLTAAAGFAVSRSTYNILPPPFIRFLSGSAWTSTRVHMGGITGQGTVRANTVCIKSIATCQKATVTFTTSNNTISGTSGNCTFQDLFISTAAEGTPLQFGIAVATCPSSPAPSLETSPVAFYIVNGTTSFGAICQPSLNIQRADAVLNSTTSALIAVENQIPLRDGDSGGIDWKSAPFNGSAFNALLFSSVPAKSTLDLNATTFSLGSAITKNFVSADPSMTDANAYVQVASDTYGHYLGMIAQPFYYKLVTGETIPGTLHLVTERLFVSAVVTHILAAIFIIMAIGGGIILVLHRRARRNLRLASEPGTLAAAVSVAGNSDLPHLLDGKDTDLAMKAMLSDLHFGIDRDTGRVRVAEAPHGYSDVPRTPLTANYPAGRTPPSTASPYRPTFAMHNRELSSGSTPLLPLQKNVSNVSHTYSSSSGH